MDFTTDVHALNFFCAIFIFLYSIAMISISKSSFVSSFLWNSLALLAGVLLSLSGIEQNNEKVGITLSICVITILIVQFFIGTCFFNEKLSELKKNR
ncbi:MAG: hypothetical protein LBF84_01960 [Holosporales bacterium]|jgi:hypothetical protein|nr:hypothetical protein [Holosporales bacterium]